MTTKPYAEWLKELDKVTQKKDDDGWSAHELSILWGCGIKLTHKHIRDGLSKGLFTTGKRTITKIDGVRSPIVVYCYTKKGRKK